MRLRSRRSAEEPALPLPPMELRRQVGPVDDRVYDDPDGRLVYPYLEESVYRSVFDFGCGCGRVARHWAQVKGPKFYGCDYNAKAVQWCRRSLPYLDARTNGLAPPLPYPDASFDLVYAFSVFTHLTEPLQYAWRDELVRVLKPGGYLYTTMQGDVKAGKSLEPDSAERAAYDRGEIVVVNGAVVGANLCLALTPRSWVENAFGKQFEMVDFSPGMTDVVWPQELYLMRKR
jgi:SAM-dependent methyltransferase